MPETTPATFYQPQEPAQPTPQPAQQPVQQVPQQTIQNIRIEPLYVAEKKKINGFWRNISIVLLLLSGFALLLDMNNIFSLNAGGFNFMLIIPFIVLLSCIVLWWYKGFLYKLIGIIFTLIIFVGIGGIAIYHSLLPGSSVSYEEQLMYEPSDALAYTLYFDGLAGDYTFAQRDTTVRLFEGLYTADRSIFVSSGTENTLPALHFNEDKNWNVLQTFRSTLKGFFSKNYVYNIYVKQFLGNISMDLSDVQFDLVKLHALWSKIDLKISDTVRETSDIEIQGAIMPNITLHAPKDIGIQLYYKQLAGSLKLTGMKEVGKRLYQTDGYETKEKKIKITVNVGYGNFTLELE